MGALTEWGGIVCLLRYWPWYYGIYEQSRHQTLVEDLVYYKIS